MLTIPLSGDQWTAPSPAGALRSFAIRQPLLSNVPTRPVASACSTLMPSFSVPYPSGPRSNGAGSFFGDGDDVVGAAVVAAAVMGAGRRRVDRLVLHGRPARGGKQRGGEGAGQRHRDTHR
ncbi:hypothetical protein [Asanoa siamensis]|uniref:Uncharacterized protein n=1 Tax=Asanoa siamensis TaxID=926357 RepID=A0ABQ4CLX6_9ACTN|nr:hypothetical protein [Asanoa siamensis]GIF72279.1 hypothetical protein Asi02nite_17970 [Asanoa siamensis]